ncbi:MAG: DUF3857 domain-containing protein [Flavobacteriaceae bacterium]
MKKILLFLLLISQITIGQTTDYSNEDYYYIRRTKHLKIAMDKEKITIENDILEQAKFNSSNKLFYANENIYTDSFTEITDIGAYTVIPSTHKKMKVNHFETKDQIGGSVFYSDSKVINFVFPAVTKGAETILTYKEQINEPHFSSTFAFGSGVPIQESVYSVEVDKSIELGFATFNFDGFDINFEKKENRKTTVYTWKANDVKAFEKASNSLSMLKYLPHVIIYIKNYEVKNKKVAIYDNLDDLYSWNASLNDQIEKSDLSEVHKITEDLTKGLKTDDEKAKVIFNWVQKNINYVAFEYGMGGLIPRDAAKVCNKRYGDCKDMANLLYEMLNHVGIDAHHTWIGSRDKPYSHAEIPTGKVYDHMITVAFIGDKVVFLDATDNYVPYGMPSAFIQGKEGMIGISDSEYKIVTVPEQAKEKNTTLIKTIITLEDNILKASGKRTMTGYEMVDFVHDVKFVKDDKTDEQYLSTKLAIGNNKTKYTNIDLGDVTSHDSSYSISYDIEMSNYIKKFGSKIFLNLNLEKPLSKDIIKIDTQLYGKEINHKYIRNYETTFIIPDGYTLKSIPKNIANEQEDYGYSFTFTQKENQLIVNKQIYLNTLAMQNDEFEAYNNFIKSLIKAYKKSIVLEKNN